MINNRKFIKVDETEPPSLMVVVDTEEEFNWNEFPDRGKTSVSSMDNIHRTQDICQQYGLAPCYVIDYPIASQDKGVAPLKAFHDQGQCEIGAHLHPWVNPPYDEELSFSNMYPGNLSESVERQKLTQLRNMIDEQFGSQPIIYKAGRYGFGPNTEQILKDLGFKIDVSFCPPLDSSYDGGPDYSSETAQPFWFGENHEFIELPNTGAFVGCAGKHANSLYKFGQSGVKLKLPAIFSRAGIVDRLFLSPEGYTPNEHIKLTEHLIKSGVRHLTWSFHSPSVEPGHTSYVQSQKDLETFLDSFKRYFDYFFGTLGGVATTPTTLYKQLESTR